ncbi:MAG: hypothetical protein GXP49_10635 [Deltaproteobacteria bacterium]|nr:hypothetical protein [Deltaproteobacteria bacterium]
MVILRRIAIFLAVIFTLPCLSCNNGTSGGDKDNFEKSREKVHERKEEETSRETDAEPDAGMDKDNRLEADTAEHPPDLFEPDAADALESRERHSDSEVRADRPDIGEHEESSLDGTDSYERGPEEKQEQAGDMTDGSGTGFTAVTFNTGIHPKVGRDGFTSDQDKYLGDYYGHGLCWGPAIDEAKAFLQDVSPDVVVFQELFDVEECASIPDEAKKGFVCEGWSPGSPAVTETILGPGYIVACNWNKHDKCVGIKKSFARLKGCNNDYCPDGLFGSKIQDCGGGARVGRGVLEVSTGSILTLVNVHGSSGVKSSDMDCRTKQVEQVFQDLGDGRPAANGAINLIMGDFNTDPRSATALALDPSARRWADFVGNGKDFHFINEYVKSYSNTFCIDNMISNVLEGDCWVPGVTGNHPDISPEGYFDHHPSATSTSDRKGVFSQGLWGALCSRVPRRSAVGCSQMTAHALGINYYKLWFFLLTFRGPGPSVITGADGIHPSRNRPAPAGFHVTPGW